MALNVLIAEDNLFTIQQYNRILEKNGYTVTIAQDGEECVQKYNEALEKKEFKSIESTPFDVVLIDNNMPKKSGAEAAKEILDKRPSQRIIFASAYDIGSLLNVPNLIEEAVEILQKPFSLHTMMARIQNK